MENFRSGYKMFLIPSKVLQFLSTNSLTTVKGLERDTTPIFSPDGSQVELKKSLNHPKFVILDADDILFVYDVREGTEAMNCRLPKPFFLTPCELQIFDRNSLPEIRKI